MAENGLKGDKTKASRILELSTRERRWKRWKR
jgi:hypothetical protein